MFSLFQSPSILVVMSSSCRIIRCPRPWRHSTITKKKIYATLILFTHFLCRYAFSTRINGFFCGCPNDFLGDMQSVSSKSYRWQINRLTKKSLKSSDRCQNTSCHYLNLHLPNLIWFFSKHLFQIIMKSLKRIKKRREKKQHQNLKTKSRRQSLRDVEPGKEMTHVSDSNMIRTHGKKLESCKL